MSNEHPTYLEGLRKLDEEWQVAELPADARARFAARQIRRRRSRRWSVVLAWSTAIASCAIAVAVVLHTPSDDFRVAEGTMVWSREADEIRISDGEGTFEIPARRVRITVRGPTRLSRSNGELRVIAGRAALAVEPRRPGEATVRVLVSHGAIDVVGTRFEITQSDASGAVRLDEGSIRFTDDDGTVTLLQPGQTLTWSPSPRTPPKHTPLERTVVPPAPEPAAPREKAPKTARVTDQELQARLAEIDRLRLQQRYASLAKAIAALLPDVHDSSLRESLSYELGDVLTHRQSEPRRACAHWADHLRRYPNGRYTSAIAETRTSLGCSQR